MKEHLSNPNVQAFLRVIRAGESSQDDSAYTIMYGGGHFEAPPWEHPRTPVKAGAWTSTAAGAYQFLAKTWDGLVKQYGFQDFSPANQDIAAVALISGRKALADVLAGRFEAAILKCNKEWASLPGSPYGQPVMTMAKAREIYTRYGGQLTKSEAPSMPLPALALISTFGPMLADLIPQVAKLFSSGSEVANRNVAAATAVFDTVVKASGEPNIQSAIEAMQKSEDVRQGVTQAVVTDPTIMGLLEVGAGVALAREKAADPNQIEWWRNPAVILALAILPLVYMVVSAVVFGVGSQTWSDDVKTLTVTAILSGALGSITGFFLGSSLGSQRKTTMLGDK